MDFIINTILTVTTGITVALLVLQLLRRDLKIRPDIITSVSILLLLGSTIYLVKVPAEFVVHYYSGGDYEHYTFKKGTFLPFIIFGFAWLFSYGLVPQILWIKKLRRRLSTLLIIVGMWAITRLLVPWGLYQLLLNPFAEWNRNSEFSFLDYVEQGAVYATAFAIIYSYLSRKGNDNDESDGGSSKVD